MRKSACLFLTLLVLGNTLLASVKLTGLIGGKYKFEMELVKSMLDHDFGVRGRYNYVGKTQSLDLKGNYYNGQVLYLAESFGGKETGEFYVRWDDTGNLIGTWLGNGKAMDVFMNVTGGDMDELLKYDLRAISARTNLSRTGSYVLSNNFINDMYYTDDNKELEVGFNGGVVIVEEVGKDKIRFMFDLICGPTYHMAFLEGEAQRIAPDTYRYYASPMDDGEYCEVVFKFSDRKLTLEQPKGTDGCGFGARAYAEGNFMKVNDIAVKSEEDETTIEMVLPKQ